MSEINLIGVQRITFIDPADKTCVEIEAISEKKPFPDIPSFREALGLNALLEYSDGTTQETDDYYGVLSDLIDKGRITSVSDKEYKQVSVSFSDITDEELLGCASISQESLKDKEQGVLVKSGSRIFEVNMDAGDFFVGNTIKARIKLTHINSVPCTDRNFVTEYYSLTDNKCRITIDTDILADAFSGDNASRKYVTLNGNLEVLCQSFNGTVTYKYPVMELVCINTDPKICDRIVGTPASIDFGTSSTCVAIEIGRRYELLTLSNNEDIAADASNTHKNQYENPTNIMIRNWDKLYSEWQNSNDDNPVLYKGNNNDDMLDFGYSVKDLLSNPEIRRNELNAILSLIKMIPYRVIKRNEQIEVRPLADESKHIDVVIDPENQSETKLDPVALYGFLIGRSINNPSARREIFTHFNITSPVMFNKDIKKTLQKSLEYGLKRAVPKTLRSMVKVEMKYTEPVAYIGAMSHLNYFPVEMNQVRKFAVYDLGGGTLDFSFGTVSSLEENDYTADFNIAKVGGIEDFGGEKIAKHIAYQMYQTARLYDKEYPLEVSREDEDILDEISTHLISPSDYGRMNMNKLVKYAREVFEVSSDDDKMTNKIDAKGKKITLSLFKLDGTEDTETFILTDEDYEAYEDDLKKQIEKTIKQFADEMDSAFKSEGEAYKKEDVTIFLAGNCSRSIYVRECMKEVFKNEEQIKFIDETGEKPSRYALTPKTAVAIGQLKINNIEQKGDSAKFKFYIGYFTANNSFIPRIESGCDNNAWVRYMEIKNNCIDLRYSAGVKPASDGDAKTMPIYVKPEDIKKQLFIRVKDETSIEYCIYDKKTPPENDDEVEINECELN